MPASLPAGWPRQPGVKQGLVHYYFGSMEELLTQTLERFVDQLAELLEALYADPNLTFAEKWRLGAQFWVNEPTSRFPKIMLELLAMGWNMPSLQPRLAEEVHTRFRLIFENYFGQAMRDYGLDEDQFPLKVDRGRGHQLSTRADRRGALGRSPRA